MQSGRVSAPVCGEVHSMRLTTVPHSYDVALLYLDQASYDLDKAVGAYQADEQWEQGHSFEAAKKGKSKAFSSRRKWGFGGLTSQLT